jgi:hypothetical protein
MERGEKASRKGRRFMLVVCLRMVREVERAREREGAEG